ncbi:His-Xaa-Ser system radical SAM maturase HxsC [Gammaproteobacteria bacterium]|nr:His-Xaa-Ser system radical SAM maturase HxsC [Gammaproteobacteria bacterium]
MLKLYGTTIPRNIKFKSYKLLTITKNYNLPIIIKDKYALILDSKKSAEKGFGAYLSFDENTENFNLNNVFILKDHFKYFEEGDIVKIDASGRVNSLFRKKSKHNTILLTERCNHKCIMCSQPPKEKDDSWLLQQTMDLIEIIPKDTINLGYSGGEPTLYGDDFIKLLDKTKRYLPNTGIDVLTNGRSFSNRDFAQKIAKINHPNCMFGIPLYSHNPEIHNYVVQSDGAFDETVSGILNMKKFGQKIEIRIVIHKQTIDTLISTCEYIARNLIFVDHVALMGLEITGYTRANLQELWIDPNEYREKLSEAVKILNTYKVVTSVYNHQLCLLNDDVLPNYIKSISDWKNEYVDECEKCTKKSLCGGFFSSSKKYRYSDNIKAFN